MKSRSRSGVPLEMDPEIMIADGKTPIGGKQMRRPKILGLFWLGGAVLCAMTSSVIAAEPTAAEQLAAEAVRSGQTRNTAAVATLMRQLSHESSVVRQSSAWALSELGQASAEAVPALTAALDDSDVRVRWAAATALGRIGRAASIAETVLWHATLDRDIEVSCAALIALRSVSVGKPTAAMPALCECLRSPVADVQSEAIATLSVLHSNWEDETKWPLVSHLATTFAKSKKADLRLAAAVLLGDLGLSAAEAMPKLAEAADDIDEHVQAAVLRAISRFANETKRRWWLVDADQRTALSSNCAATAKCLRERSQISADVAHCVEQFDQLIKDAQQTSLPESVRLRRGPQTSVNSDTEDLKALPSEAMSSRSAIWRWSLAALLICAGVWGLRRQFSNRTAPMAPVTDVVLSESTSSGDLVAHGDPTEDIAARRAAIDSLSDLAIDATVDLNRAMRDSDAVVRWRSASAVTAVHAATVPQLLQAVTSSDPEVRRLAITSLRGLGTHALPPFLRALQDSDARTRQAAAVTLGQIGPGAIDAVPQLVEALSDVEPQVRAAAAFSLSSFGPHAMEAVPALRTALSDEFAAVRARAAFALGQIGPSARRVAEEFVRLVSDPDVSVRSNVVSAIGAIGADIAVIQPALRKAAGDSSADVRRVALTTLALLDAGCVVTANHDSEVAPQPISIQASRSAKTLTKSSPRTTSQQLKVFDPDHVEQPAIVGNVEESVAATDFIAQLEHADADVRWRASLALERLGASAVPEMISALNHRNPGVRRLLIVTLGRVGTEARSATPAMLVALHDVNSDVRCAAADSLGQLGVVTRPLVQALTQALTDSSAEVRRYAATTLGRFGQQAREATAALRVSSISDIATKVRTAAQTALQRVSESLVGAA